MSDAAALAAGEASGPGPRLRRARETRGLSQQQAAEVLNLDVAVVEALEHDDFSRLGAPVFAKGHLRRYGTMLGLAADELIAGYEHAGAQPEVPTLVPRARQEMMPVRGRPKWPWVVGGALLFLLAAGLAAYVSEHGFDWRGEAGDATDVVATDESVVTEALEPASVPTTAQPFAASAVPAQASAQPEPAAGGTAVEPSPLPVPQGHVSIKLTFATDSWAEVYDGSGQAVLYDLGRAGSQRSIAAAAPLSVTIGNAAGVTLLVNGRPANLPAVQGGGTVARFRIEADGTVR